MKKLLTDNFSLTTTLLLTWATITGILFLTTGHYGHVTLHLSIILLLLFLETNKGGALNDIRLLTPLLLTILFYAELDSLVLALYDGVTYDAWLQSINNALFNGSLWHTFNQHFTTVFWRETMHFSYLTYYALFAGSYLYAWRQGQEALAAYAFTLIGSMLTFFTAFLLFPAGGPLHHAQDILSTEGIFPFLVASLYQPTIQNGVYAAAFPSSHVGIAVVIACYLGRKKWQQWFLWSLVVLIALATVYTKTHYAIDAIIAVPFGLVTYTAWTTTYPHITIQE